MLQRFLPLWFNSNLVTSLGENSRLKVENADTAFFEGNQFRFFDVIDSVASTQQKVYKFTATNAVDIINRELNLWEGSREYLVYPDTANVTFDDGLLTTVNQIYPVNGREVKTSGVTVQRAIVSGGDVFTSTDNPRNGTIVKTDSNSNRASTSYGVANDRAGVASGQSFYLVHNYIGAGTQDTSGQFLIVFDEYFNV